MRILIGPPIYTIPVHCIAHTIGDGADDDATLSCKYTDTNVPSSYSK
jgi:hypothetical protein